MRRKPDGIGDSSAKGLDRGKKWLQDHRIPEVRGWEAEVRGLHMDPTEEDEFCSRREVGTKGWKNILVQRLIDTVRK